MLLLPDCLFLRLPPCLAPLSKPLDGVAAAVVVGAGVAVVVVPAASDSVAAVFVPAASVAVVVTACVVVADPDVCWFWVCCEFDVCPPDEGCCEFWFDVDGPPPGIGMFMLLL